MKKKFQLSMMALFFMVSIFSACSSGNKTITVVDEKDTLVKTVESGDTSSQVTANANTENNANQKTEKPVVLIYNFHVTNRCVSCIAIEEATTKTLNTYFASEMKQGRIKRQILNVDDEANAAISEKYQAFGSGLFVTRIFKGKEDIADLTGTGFKFAKNKEEKFIEVLKNQINSYLK
jgi:tryptophanyl-tRNA synthetase